MRLFVAIDPGEDLAKALEDEIAALRLLSPTARWVSPATVHVTLAFVGEVDEGGVAEVKAAVCEAAATSAPFRLRVEGGFVFGESRAHVLWAGLMGETDALTGLQRRLAEALSRRGVVLEERPFTAHLTLARARAARGDPALLVCAQTLASRVIGAMDVRELCLYRSERTASGVVYDVLARSPLSAARGDAG